ncbi:beta-propeller fold lactonase family protein [Nocardia alni]|uniref:YVTN family beta-propeller repeat protein n=1 Tax=Nocardia alni TaxID=2815723 RepID=UPI001C21A372|nr:beta-propeller fold lactonase family protein [Nocardia alni]
MRSREASEVVAPGRSWRRIRSGQLWWLVFAAVTLVALLLAGALLVVMIGDKNSTRGATAALPASRSAVPSPYAPSSASSAILHPAPSIAEPVVMGKVPVPAPQALAVPPAGWQGLVIGGDHRVYGLALGQGAAAPMIYTPLPPRFASFTPDGRHAYISTYGDNDAGVVEVLDIASNAILDDIPVGLRPYSLAVTPNGGEVWVPDHDSSALSVIDTSTDTVVATIPVAPNPHWISFTPDGKTAFVADHESNLVSVIDVAGRTVRATIPVPESPHCVVVSPDGSQALVASYNAASVSFIDTATLRVTTTAVGQNPQSIAYARDGRHAYVADNGSGSVSVLDTATRQVTATLGVGAGPDDVAVSPDDRYAFVAAEEANAVTVLSIAANR